MATAPTQEIIEKQIIGKRIVAVAWVPVPGVDGLFVLASIKLEGGATLKFQGSDDAVFVILKESDHADAQGTNHGLSAG